MFEGIAATVIGGIILFYVTRYLTRIYSKTDKKKPGPKPKKIIHIWNVPHARNPNFTGRKDLLKDLRNALTSGKHSALTQAISGLGGVGKTQLALEYNYRHCGEYKVVWWLRSEEPAILSGDFAALAEELGLVGEEETNQRIKIQAARKWLEQNSGWLLVFDNAESPDALQGYLPHTRTGHLIITSRNPHWRGVAEPLEIKVLEPEDAATFLLRRTGQKDKAAARKLTKQLGHLPLALEQAGAYMETTGKSLADYLKLFEKYRKELLARHLQRADYQKTVTTTWEISFEKAREECPAGIDLLSLFAFLAPDEIPLDIITQGKENLPDSLNELAEKPFTLDEAIAALLHYSFIKHEERKVSVHRLVQAVVRDRLGEKDEKTWAGAAVSLMQNIFPFDQYKPETWQASRDLMPHAMAAAGHAERLGSELEDASYVLNEMGTFLRTRAEFTQAKAMFERSLKIAEALYGPDHPEVATYVNNLGSVLLDMGDLEGARCNFERALSINEAIYGPDHPEIATYVNNLGSVLRVMGDLEGARSNVKRALSIDEAYYGPAHPVVARDVNNLGDVLRLMGDLEGARSNFERALSIDEAEYGPDHPDVAIVVNNLGIVLKAMGDLEGARSNFERALSIDEAVYGTDHPNVAIRINNLGLVLQAMGDLEGARSNFERALSIDETVYGTDHLAVARDVNNLGGVLLAIGDLEAARRNGERALDICRKFLGEEHPRTKTVKNNLKKLQG